MADRVEEITFEVTAACEGGYCAHALGASIFAQAEDLAGLKAAVRDAVICHFEGGHAPRMVWLHLGNDDLLAV